MAWACPRRCCRDWLPAWLTVHGQSEQHLLLSPARQRQCLDGFGGEAVTGLLASYTETLRVLG
ncbi:MAG: hypothetical protein WKF73_16270 [Nocardioidaceae bacterium]